MVWLESFFSERRESQVSMVQMEKQWPVTRWDKESEMETFKSNSPKCSYFLSFAASVSLWDFSLRIYEQVARNGMIASWSRVHIYEYMKEFGHTVVATRIVLLCQQSKRSCNVIFVDHFNNSICAQFGPKPNTHKHKTIKFSTELSTSVFLALFSFQWFSCIFSGLKRIHLVVICLPWPAISSIFGFCGIIHWKHNIIPHKELNEANFTSHVLNNGKGRRRWWWPRWNFSLVFIILVFCFFGFWNEVNSKQVFDLWVINKKNTTKHNPFERSESWKERRIRLNRILNKQINQMKKRWTKTSFLWILKWICSDFEIDVIYGKSSYQSITKRTFSYSNPIPQLVWGILVGFCNYIWVSSLQWESAFYLTDEWELSKGYLACE